VTTTVCHLLSADHARLDALLNRALEDPESVDRASFDEFRVGLLRHISIEEKLLLPLARDRRGGAPLPEAKALRADHSCCATLLVPTPTIEIVRELSRRLRAHNAIEEGEEGVYARIDALLSDEEQRDLAENVRAFPAPPVATYSDNPRSLARVRALLDAGPSGGDRSQGAATR